MADGRHIENRFWQYLGAILADLCKFRNGDEESHADIGHLTKTAIFVNSRWRTAAILKIALSPYLSRELSDFDQIWFTQMQISIPSMKFDKKSKFFKFKMADGHHIENRFWLYLSAILADLCKLRNGDEESHADSLSVT